MLELHYPMIQFLIISSYLMNKHLQVMFSEQLFLMVINIILPFFIFYFYQLSLIS